MRKFESNVQYIKYMVNKELVKRLLSNTLSDSIESLQDISEKLIPGPKPMTRCCIYKERHIIQERAKLTMKPLEGYNVIKILPEACDECPIDRFVVTEACRGCLGHKCHENCPKDAIIIMNHKAYIDQNKCIECGRCKAVCPFNAISEVQRPCIRSCAINAISMDENRKAHIDNDKCVSCGACVYNCPFGAIVDKSYVLDIMKLIKDSENNTKYKVYAVVAPAISSQFTDAKINQVIGGIEKIGFYHAVEAALGADVVAYHEGHEFAETIDERKWMTTSCCPAFVSYMRKNYPDMMSHVSGTVSPMVAIARIIKSTDPTAKVVFIGPCTAKKMEIKLEDIKDAVEYTMTFEELQAIFDAMDINLKEIPESVLDNASYYGRIFARSGGVTDAVTQIIKLEGIDKPFKPTKCDGLADCVKIIKVASMGKLPFNFIEGMACKGGCIGGAASLSHGPKDLGEVDKYGKLSKEENSLDAIRVFDLDSVNLERDYGKNE